MKWSESSHCDVIPLVKSSKAVLPSSKDLLFKNAMIEANNCVLILALEARLDKEGVLMTKNCNCCPDPAT